MGTGDEGPRSCLSALPGAAVSPSLRAPPPPGFHQSAQPKSPIIKAVFLGRTSNPVSNLPSQTYGFPRKGAMGADSFIESDEQIEANPLPGPKHWALPTEEALFPKQPAIENPESRGQPHRLLVPQASLETGPAGSHCLRSPVHLRPSGAFVSGRFGSQLRHCLGKRQLAHLGKMHPWLTLATETHFTVISFLSLPATVTNSHFPAYSFKWGHLGNWRNKQ